MEILRICLGDQLLIKYYVKKRLILLKIQCIMNVNEDCLQWFEKRFGKNLSVGAVTRA